MSELFKKVYPPCSNCDQNNSDGVFNNLPLLEENYVHHKALSAQITENKQKQRTTTESVSFNMYYDIVLRNLLSSGMNLWEHRSTVLSNHIDGQNYASLYLYVNRKFRIEINSAFYRELIKEADYNFIIGGPFNVILYNFLWYRFQSRSPNDFRLTGEF